MAKSKKTLKSNTHNLTKKPSNIEEVVKHIQGIRGKDSIFKLSDAPLHTRRIPTGLLPLDLILNGGIVQGPKGRVLEFYGPESSSKSSLNIHIMGVIQWIGYHSDLKHLKEFISGIVALIDAENTFDPDYATVLGLDVDNLLLSQPDSGEAGLEMAEILMRSKVDYVNVDSVAALVPRSEIEGDMGDAQVGVQARMMSQGLRKLTAIDTTTITSFINQLRMKIGVMFGSPETTSGGNALKFYSSVRIDTRRADVLGEKENPEGVYINLKIVKNKTAPPFRKLKDNSLLLHFQRGFDVLHSFWWIVKRYLPHTIEKSGTWYSFKGERLGQGDAKVVEFFMRNPNMVIPILNELHSVIPMFDLEFYKEYLPYKMEQYAILDKINEDETPSNTVSIEISKEAIDESK